MSVTRFELTYERKVDVEVGVCDGCGKQGELVEFGDTWKWDARGWGMWKWPLDTEPHWTRGLTKDFPIFCSDCASKITEFVVGLKARAGKAA